jgi:hydroxyacylglutathione hydrolase
MMSAFGESMIMIETIHPIPAFTDNYIWAITEKGSNKACVVDPGDAAPVIEYLAREGLILSDILITHHHLDHTGGIRQLCNKYSPRVFGPESSNIEGITDFVVEGDCVELFGQSFSVLEIPGHTLDHIAFFSADQDQPTPILFCGDTLFAAGCGRLFEGSPAMMCSSLKKLSSLDTNTKVYCTHEYTLANLQFALAAEPDNDALLKRNQFELVKRNKGLPTLPSSIELEIATNPFIRCDKETLVTTARNRLGREPEDETEVFSTLRAWKDTF